MIMGYGLFSTFGITTIVLLTLVLLFMLDYGIRHSRRKTRKWYTYPYVKKGNYQCVKSAPHSG